MRALVLTRRPAPGTFPDFLEMVEIDKPVPRPREVVVQVFASTINIDDIHVAEGTFYGGIPIGRRPRPDRPVTPGSDLAGVVTAVGRDAHSVSIGESVFGVQMPLHPNGAWAEFCAVDEQWITRKPDSLSFETAAACGVSGLVAFSAMEALKLHAKQRIVIVGASGGIGAMAVQLAHRAGVEVIGVCGSANVERAYRFGCSRVIDYKLGPWDRALLAEGDTPIERVLDVVGGRDIEQMAKRVLREDGIFVTVVGPKRFIGDQALGWSRILQILLHIGGRIVGSRLRGPRYVLTGPGTGAGKELTKVARVAAAGVLPPIDSTVPFELEAVRQAIRKAAAHQNNGRIAIEMEHAA
jgi:NADPH:quinone reductase-like Zn-dependent oxidoreductase